MVLEYKFEYISNNNKYISILDNILKKENTNYSFNREDDFIFLYIEDEEDRLLKISNDLSKLLPMSIFLKDFTLEVVPQSPSENYQFNTNSSKSSYCSSCLEIIEDSQSQYFYNPFLDCDICGTTSSVNKLEVYEDKKTLEYKNYKELFELLASKIIDNKRVKINDYVFYKFEKLEKENQSLLCTNIDALSSIVVGSKQKSVALLSLEKPSIDFNVNTIYQSHNNVDVNRVNISSSWDTTLYLLSKELLLLGINFLLYEESENFDIELVYESDTKRTKVSICEGKTFLLENSDYDKRLNEVYGKFDEESKSQFLVLIDENSLYEKSILNIYSSSLYVDGISLYSPKIDGMLDVLKFNMPNSVNELLDEITKDDGGKKLLENYKEKFPQNISDALELDISTLNKDSIYSLWKIASVILGIDDIYENARKSLLQKGPRIDYKLKQSDKIFNKEFNLVRFIKSGISFKLAGVDDKTLSLGYVESFAYFLSDLIDEVNEEFKLDGVSFCGDLISKEFFYKQINKALSKELKLYYNKDFPIQL